MADLSKTGYLEPYGPTGPGLEEFYRLIGDTFGQGPPDPLTPGQQVAPFNPMQLNAFNQLGNYGTSGPGGQLLNFGMNSLGSGLNMDEVMGYADNPWMDQMIDAALRDPTRQLQESTLPGMDLQQAFSGNSNSARGDLAEGVAQRSYDDRAADVAAQMRGGAYSQGLQTAYGTRGQDQNMMNLANQIGLGNIDASLLGGGMMQNQQQNLRNAGFDNWQYGANAPWQWAQNYSNLATPGAATFGTKYGTDTSQDFMDVLLGGLGGGALGGLFQGLFGGPTQPGQAQDTGIWGNILDSIGL